MLMKFLRIAALLTGLSMAGAARAQPALTSFAVGNTTVTASELVSNLNIVWELRWGPDNFLWMTERHGRVSRVNPATGQVLPLLNVPDVTQHSEGGLLGMVLHPQFATSPYVYLVYSYTNPGGQVKVRLARYTYSAAANSLANPVTLLEDIGTGVYHFGSRLVILPDLTLLMTTGDANDANTAQDLRSLNGKTLRLNLDGTVPANNPIPGSYVYSWGHRNSQGLVQAPSGRIYSSEHGQSTDDEINLIEPNRNYGWPNVEGYCNLPAEASFCAANNVREPLTNWTPTIAPAALAYYDHPAIPGWRNSLLLACLNGNKLVHLPLDAAGTGIGPRADFLTAQGRLRAVCVSPQGRVYIGTSASTPTNRVLVLENRAYLATKPAAARLEFQLAPNPAGRQATLRLPASGLHLTVRDLLGRVVYTQRSAPATTTLNLAQLCPGTYLVEARGPQGTGTKRLVVE